MAEKLHDDGLAQLWLGDARDMSFLQDESVDCIVTSPPYWSLRKYGKGAELVWDAAEGCEHVWGAFITDPVRPVNRRCDKCKKFGISVRTTGDQLEVHCSQCGHITRATSDTRGVVGEAEKWLDALRAGGREHTEQVKQGQFCQLCGAWRGQLGLEPSIELYLEHLLQILDTEARRVLKDSGVMWVNMGDSYASGGGFDKQDYNLGIGGKSMHQGRAPISLGLKPLDLCMIPARFALAMQQRGWYLRSRVPWLKRASMPDSVQGDRWERHRVKVRGRGTKGPTPAGWDTQHESDPAKGRYDNTKASLEWADCPGCLKCLPNDGLVLRKGNWRPGRSMEWLFLFSKTNDYYSDAEGVRLPQVDWRGSGKPDRKKLGIGNALASGFASQTGGFNEALARHGVQYNPAGRNRRESDWLYECLDEVIAHHDREARRLRHLRHYGGMLWEDGEPLALLLNPKGYKEAHFATYPIAMVEPLIKAYTSGAGNCAKCGAPWVRVVERQTMEIDRSDRRDKMGQWGRTQSSGTMTRPASSQTLGWRPSCECDAGEPIPAVVLDPFVGSGTTNAAATKLGRRSIGVDCVEEYIDLARKRLGGWFEVEVEGVKVKQEGLWEGRE